MKLRRASSCVPHRSISLLWSKDLDSNKYLLANCKTGLVDYSFDGRCGRGGIIDLLIHVTPHLSDNDALHRQPTGRYCQRNRLFPQPGYLRPAVHHHHLRGSVWQPAHHW